MSNKFLTSSFFIQIFDNQNPMQSTNKMKCYLCLGTQKLQPYDDQDCICEPCSKEQLKLLTQFKSKRTVKYPEIDMIEEGLYLGNQDAATSQDILKERNITAICVSGAHLDTPFAQNPHYAYKIIKIQDFPKQSIKQYFSDHHIWMNKMIEEKRNILVHCAAGVSRSASFVIAYLMKEQKRPYHLTLDFVKSKRKCINPNSGFKKQLIQYNQELGLEAPPPKYQQLY